jgi:hypothetical protein
VRSEGECWSGIAIKDSLTGPSRRGTVDDTMSGCSLESNPGSRKIKESRTYG